MAGQGWDMSATTTTPAGWYDDPSGQAARRWWDGSGWTEHTDGPPPLASPATASAFAPAFAPVGSTAATAARAGAGRSPVGSWLAIGGAVAAAAGCFLPWMSVAAPFVGKISVNGLEGGSDGWLILPAVLVAGIVAVVGLRTRLAWGWAAAACLAALVASAVGVYDLFNVLDAVDGGNAEDMFAASMGPGVVLAAVGSVAATVGTAIMVLAARTDTSRPAVV